MCKHDPTAGHGQPEDIFALRDRGLVLRARCELVQAMEHYEQLVRVRPYEQADRKNLAAVLAGLGNQAKLAGNRGAATQFYERALSLDQDQAEALYGLGVNWMEEGHADRAIFFFESTLRCDSRHADALNNLGVLERERGNNERAEAHYAEALRVRPDFSQPLNNIAVIRTELGRAAEAMALLEAAIDASPSDANAYNNLGVAHLDLGEVPEALESYQQCLVRDPNHRSAQHNELLALNYLHGGDEPLLARAHHEWGLRFSAAHPQLPQLTEQDAARRAQNRTRPLVVGYVSPDLFTHSVSYFMEGPLRCHDPSRVQVIVYAALQSADETTQRLRSIVESRGHRWRDVGHLSEEALARRAQEDEVDILVDLAGHMSGNLLGCMAMKPAPVQISWIGYPHPTGLPQIDYWFTDALCEPSHRGERASARLRLPGCFLCYTPCPDLPEIGPLPALKNGFVTFGSFNNLAKMTPEVLHVWAELLQAVPGSRLVLKSRALSSESGRRHILGTLQAYGLDPSRVSAWPRTPSTHDHLATYNHIDVSLDPWPYAGTTTTCESLIMGVPCVTLRGPGHAQNVGVSLMAAIGIGEQWVASSTQSYVELAQRASKDLTALDRERRGLRKAMLGSSLCDAAGFTTRLETTYREIWERWCGRAVDQDCNRRTSRLSERAKQCTSQLCNDGSLISRADE